MSWRAILRLFFAICGLRWFDYVYICLFVHPAYSFCIFASRFALRHAFFMQTRRAAVAKDCTTDPSNMPPLAFKPF